MLVYSYPANCTAVFACKSSIKTGTVRSFWEMSKGISVRPNNTPSAPF